MCIFFVKPYVYWATGEWQAWTEERERVEVGTVLGQNIYIPSVATHQRLRGRAWSTSLTRTYSAFSVAPHLTHPPTFLNPDTLPYSN